MLTCGRCDRALRQGVSFCTHCGASANASSSPASRPVAPPRQEHAEPSVSPFTRSAHGVVRPGGMPSPQPQPPPQPPAQPPPSSSPTRKAGAGRYVLVTFAALLVVSAVALLGSGVLDGDPADGTRLSGGEGGAVPFSRQVPPTPAGPVVTPSTTTPASRPSTVPTSSNGAGVSPIITGPDAAQKALAQQVESDRSAVGRLVGYWVPQLSSKRLGLVHEGITYGYLEIWQDFVEIKTRYPEALLLWSGDFATFKFDNFWITVMPMTYTTGESANSWCDSAGIPAEDCYAKKLDLTGGYEGATMHRR